MASLASMKQRVATAQAILKASELSTRNRDVRIMGFLEKVEEVVAQKQQQISDLKKERDDALDELWAICDVDNTASARVLEKAGFTLECVLPSRGRHRGFESRRDCRRYKALVSGCGS